MTGQYISRGTTKSQIEKPDEFQVTNLSSLKLKSGIGVGIFSSEKKKRERKKKIVNPWCFLDISIGREMEGFCVPKQHYYQHSKKKKEI